MEYGTLKERRMSWLHATNSPPFWLLGQLISSSHESFCLEGCGNVAGTERRKLICKKLVSVARVDKMDSIVQVVHRMRRYLEKLLNTNATN